MTPSSKLPFRRARRWAKALAALLGLASSDPGFGRAEAACESPVVSRLPLTSKGGHFYTVARIDGVETDLLVDTGAALSALDQSVATRLKLKQDATRNTAVIGINGRVQGALPILAVARLELGALTLDKVTMVRGEFHRGRPAASRADGIIGADLLGSYDVEFDPSHGELVLHAIKGCTGVFIDWPGAASIPLQPFYQERLKSAPVTVDGHALSALVDTGATQSVLFAAGVRRLGDAARRSPTDGSGFGVGATGGKRVDVRLHRFAALRIGNDVLPDLVLAIAPTSPMNLDMVLGLDVLGRRHFWLSYATNQLFLAPP